MRKPKLTVAILRGLAELARPQIVVRSGLTCDVEKARSWVPEMIQWRKEKDERDAANAARKKREAELAAMPPAPVQCRDCKRELPEWCFDG